MSWWEQLRAPFPAEDVRWRIGTKRGGRGLALAYLDARAVMDRLDAVVGPENWCCDYHPIGEKTVLCRLGINVSSITSEPHWVFKTDGADPPQFEPEKGQLSDALKRAAVRWGIGRYLYDVAAPWVEVDEHGRITDAEHYRLQALLAERESGTTSITGMSGPTAPGTPAPPPTPRPAPEPPPAASTLPQPPPARAATGTAQAQKVTSGDLQKAGTWKRVFRQAEAIHGPGEEHKFAPLEWALEQIGVEHWKQLTVADLNTLNAWIETYPGAGGTYRGPAEDEGPPPPTDDDLPF